MDTGGADHGYSSALAEYHIRTSIDNFAQRTRTVLKEQFTGWLCHGVRVIRGGRSYGYPFYSDTNRFTHTMGLIQLPAYEDPAMTGTFLEAVRERLVNTLLGL